MCMNTLAQHSFAHAGAHSLQNRQRSPPTISAHYSRAGGSLHSAPQQQGVSLVQALVAGSNAHTLTLHVRPLTS